MPPKLIALLVEGEGDVNAAPVLVKRVIKSLNLSIEIQPDPNPLRIGEVAKFTGRNREKWDRYLRLAIRTRNADAALLLVDGDCKKFENKPFCAKDAAAELHKRARDAGAGANFSAACVFACMEYESWFLAAIPSLAGKRMPPDNREGVKSNASWAGNTEQAPRNAKGELNKLMVNGYKPTTDQEPLTRLLDIDLLRNSGCRSFLRLDSAIRQLAEALRTGRHIPTS